MIQIRTVEAARGWRWLVQGLAIFRKAPAQWLMLNAILFIGSRVLLAIPFVGLVVILITPNFLAGLTHGAQALEQGKPLRLGYLASGFLKNAAQLVTLGGVSLIGHFLMLMAMTTVSSPLRPTRSLWSKPLKTSNFAACSAKRRTLATPSSTSKPAPVAPKLATGPVCCCANI